LTLALLVTVNFGVHVIHTMSATDVAESAPHLVRTLEAQNRVEARRVLLGSGIILMAVMAFTVLATHKTAGAAFRLTRGIDDLCQGKYGGTVTLRRGDRLRSLEQSINELSRVLLARGNRTADKLDAAAETAERISDPHEARTLAEHLRELARRHRC
jgi:signal transduction histidine kinase